MLQELEQAVYSEYSRCIIPIDRELVSELNNIIKDHNIYEIISDLSSFKEIAQGWNPHNIFAISTLPFPQKISYLQ